MHTRLTLHARAAVLFEKPRGRPFHGKMAALVASVQRGGVALK